jgi:recombination protein RecA
VKVVKNKVAPPFRQTEFQIMYGKGIHRLGEVIDLGVKLNLIDKSGAWYAYKGDKIGQGKKNASIYLEENIALAEELEESIRSELLSDPRKRKDVEEEALKDKEIPANDDIVILADVK